MNRENLKLLIELTQQRLEANQAKYAKRNTDPNRAILGTMYKVLAEHINEDQRDLSRLKENLAMLGLLPPVPKKKSNQLNSPHPTPSVAVPPTPKKKPKVTQQSIWGPQDAALHRQLVDLLRFWQKIKNEQIWSKRTLKTYSDDFAKKIKETRAFLSGKNRPLQELVNKELDTVSREFQIWHDIQLKQADSYGPAYRVWLKLPETLDQRLEALQDQIAQIKKRRLSSEQELAACRKEGRTLIDSTHGWVSIKYLKTRRLPPEKLDGVKAFLDFWRTDFEQWTTNQQQRLKQTSSTPAVNQSSSQTESGSEKQSFLTVDIFWADVTFKDRFIDIQASLSISQVFHHLNYSLPFDTSRRSFQAFAPVLDSLISESLKVKVSIRDRTIVGVVNAHILAEVIGFLEIRETFGWLSWNVYRGKPQVFDNSRDVRKYPGLNRHECLRHLSVLQSSFHRIIHVTEYSSANDMTAGSAASDAFLFTIDQGSCLYIIWENEEKRLATYLFRTTPKRYYAALQRIHDYISSKTIKAKRTRLRDQDLAPFNGTVDTCGFIIHEDLRDWQTKLSYSLR